MPIALACMFVDLVSFAMMFTVNPPALQFPGPAYPPAEKTTCDDATTMHSYNLFFPPLSSFQTPYQTPKSQVPHVQHQMGYEICPP
jgi:hypothetical protein